MPHGGSLQDARELDLLTHDPEFLAQLSKDSVVLGQTGLAAGLCMVIAVCDHTTSLLSTQWARHAEGKNDYVMRLYLAMQLQQKFTQILCGKVV